MAGATLPAVSGPSWRLQNSARVERWASSTQQFHRVHRRLRGSRTCRRERGAAQFLAGILECDHEAAVAVHLDGQQRGRQCRLGLTRPLQNDARRIAPPAKAISVIRPIVDARNWRRLRASTACHRYSVRRLKPTRPRTKWPGERPDHPVLSGLWWPLRSRDHFRSTGVGGVPSPDCPGHG